MNDLVMGNIFITHYSVFIWSKPNSCMIWRTRKTVKTVKIIQYIFSYFKCSSNGILKYLCYFFSSRYFHIRLLIPIQLSLYFILFYYLFYGIFHIYKNNYNNKIMSFFFLLLFGWWYFVVVGYSRFYGFGIGDSRHVLGNPIKVVVFYQTSRDFPDWYRTVSGDDLSQIPTISIHFQITVMLGW